MSKVKDHQFVSMGSTPYICMQCSVHGCKELASNHDFSKTIELSEYVRRYFGDDFEFDTDTRANLETTLAKVLNSSKDNNHA
jgi:hypothetical protein